MTPTGELNLGLPVRWRVSRELTKPHDCTVAGILGRCGAGCCRSALYWPSRVYGNPGNACGNLGPAGCVFSLADRPVTCLLYPLRLRGDMLLLHHRARLATSVCKGNHGQGPPLIDALEAHLTALFGADQYADLRVALFADVGTAYVYPPPDVLDAVARETAWEDSNTAPRPRTESA